MAALVAVVAVLASLLVQPDAYRDRIAQGLSEGLGMEVTLGGPVRIAWLPGLHVNLEAVRVRNGSRDIGSAGNATLGVRLLPLLRGVISIDTIALNDASLFIERDQDGHFNFQGDGQDEPHNTVLDLTRLSLSNAALELAGQQSWPAFQATACDLEVRRLHPWNVGEKDFIKGMNFGGELGCGEIATEALTLSDVKVSVNADRGIVRFEPITMHMLDANGSGQVVADFSADIPQWAVKFSLLKFPVEAFFDTLSQGQIAAGSMDFSTDLSMQGATPTEMTQTMAGPVSLRGSDLTLENIDLDEELSQLQSSRNFNLVDVGAFFLAGPVGLAVTRGYEFASLVNRSGGTSEIRALVSDWQIERGIMRAQDVAMATAENRLALQGSLDFVNQDFDEVTVAVVDANGCVMVKQEIKGTFANPVVEPPSVFASLAGPALELLKQGQELLSGDACDVFYSGSIVAPP
jgi:AsmA protein